MRREKTNHRGQDEGFELPPIQTQQMTFKDAYDPAVRSHNNMHITNKKRRLRYASSEKPILKLTHGSQMLDTISYGRSRAVSYSIKGPAHNSLRGSRLMENIAEEGQGLSKSDRGQGKKEEPETSPQTQIEQLLQNMILKHRTEDIGCNLDIVRSDEIQEEEIKKELEMHPEATLAHKESLPPNTHSHFRGLIEKDQESIFLKNKYNSIIRKRLNVEQSAFTQQQKATQGLVFKGNFESGNLSHVIKLNAREYNIYVKVDTNTRGHQSWFYFKVINNHKQDRNILFNICSVKRKFKMVQMGQKFFMKQGEDGQWRPIENPVTMQQMQDNTYTFTCQVHLKAHQQYYFSLVPPYTYSQLLKDIEQYEQSPHLKTQILTHSLTGLSIPLLTITKDAAKNKQPKKGWGVHRKVFLINGRLHPSQTCSSFIIDGLIRELLSNKLEIEEFLSKNVVKIVPMINPDGVVFGNFRTNYLGDDLNRMFHRTDESVYPEVIALKDLGRILKEEYKENFVAFFDMHGHSNATNSFIYGPEYPQKTENYIQCRLFPKILGHFSRYFRYNMSEFRLQEYKFNTARGFFFRRLKIPGYTIETSYALYRHKKDNKVQLMGIEEWTELGRQMCGSLTFYSNYLQEKRQKSKVMIKQGNQHYRIQRRRKPKPHKQPINSDYFAYSNELMEKLKKETMNESTYHKPKDDQDSDGESEDQDLPIKQKMYLIKSLGSPSQNIFMLPRVSKTTRQPVQIKPGLAEIGKGLRGQKGTSKMVWKHESSHQAKPVSISHEYTDYLLKNIQTLNNHQNPRTAVHTLAAIKKQQKIKELTFHSYR